MRSRVLQILLVSILAILPACEKEPIYSQATPEATLRSARDMVRDGHADKLATLIHTDDPEMRLVLDRLGVFFRNTQKLALAIDQKFPAEVATLKDKIRQDAESGGAAKLMSAITRSQSNTRRGPTPKEGSEQRQDFDDSFKRLFVDPYGWLEEADTRLTTAYVDDETVSLRWDSKPILPPIGISLKQAADGNWYFVLPLHLPVISKYAPRTPAEYQILRSMVAVVNNLIVDLRLDIEQGKITNLDALARTAGEKAFMPAAMVFYAYTKAVDERKKAPAITPAPMDPK
ncbi:MAG: hypothetical protein AB7Q00_11235 [Phycisphaerales bacterium]